MLLSCDLCLLILRLTDSKILHGPFMPAGRATGSNKAKRSELPDILRAMEKRLKDDWEEVPFEVLGESIYE